MLYAPLCAINGFGLDGHGKNRTGSTPLLQAQEGVPMNSRGYLKRVEELQPKRNIARSLWRAFWVGGTVCLIGQGLLWVGQNILRFSEQTNAAFCAVALIFLAALLTGLGIYDSITTYAGAGSIVPITGFSNAMTSSGMEFRQEGAVAGVGGKIMAVAGPVIIYGAFGSCVVGLIYYLYGVIVR